MEGDQSSATPKPPEPSKLPKGLLDATKETIRAKNGSIETIENAIAVAKSQKERDGLKKALERVTKDIDELSESSVSIAAHNPKSNIYIVNAGKFGVRKVILG